MLPLRSIALFLAIVGCATGVSPSAQAGDKIWSAVLLARNVDKPAPPPKELKGVADRLERIFGYNSFEIVGSDTRPISDGMKADIKPTKAFWMNVKARQASVKEARGGYLLNLELFQKDTPLVDTVAMIAPESPLFFRGPKHGQGQILVVLQVVH